MSALEERSLDKLANMIFNVLWQNPLEVWQAIRTKIDQDGIEAARSAFEEAADRFIEGPFSEHLEVRWGMNLCVHCNDDNIEKNGIAYVDSSGDGLEFNQCLNCHIGILYKLVTATATMDTYTLAIGNPRQFNGMSIFWNAIVPEEMKKFLPTYEIVDGEGQWQGTISFDDSYEVKFLPFSAMTESTSRDAEAPWTTVLPGAITAAAESLLETAKYQVEVALALK
ncbi:MAG: hypothetical protein AM326_11425 [Candidatus Thorarchaeota archaeon SMTZ-45]|nr:MAG: hypothetical protein AM326_11425 [Candidatus Thorarchaeota archaeon SMTZ-45]